MEDRKCFILDFAVLLFQIKLSKNHTQILYVSLILFISLYSLAVGINLIKLPQNATLMKTSYSDKPDCINKLNSGSPCTLQFQIHNTIKTPLMIFYSIDNFVHNYKDYILSKNLVQLFGTSITLSQAQQCRPYMTNSDMKMNNSWAGISLSPSAVASPCGIAAYNFYTDRVKLANGHTNVNIRTNNLMNLFVREPNSNLTQWVDVESDSFEIWMTTSVSTNINKLYGVLDSGLVQGNYTFQIWNNVDYGNIKSISVVQLNNEYGENLLIGNLYIYSSIGLLVLLSCLGLLSLRTKSTQHAQHQNPV